MNVTSLKLSLSFSKEPPRPLGVRLCVHVFMSVRMRVCVCAKTYLQRESSQGRNGYQGGHKERDHVVDGRQGHAGAGATQTVSCALL